MTGRALLLLIGLLLAPALVGAVPEELVSSKQIDSVEERRILVSIEDKYAELEAREAELEKRERELKTLATEVDKRLTRMQELRQELVTLLDRKEALENERVAELSLIYERMDPANSAVLIRKLDHQLAVNLLLGIKKKTAGEILDNLDPATATALSRAFTEIPLKE